MFGLKSARSRAIAVGALGLLLLAGVSTTGAVDRGPGVILWVSMGLSTAAFVAVATTVTVVIMSTVRPLAALQASARAITAGDPQARAKVSGPEEVASLARDFNEMTDALSAQVQEYIDTTNLTGITLLRVDKDNRVTFLNDAMCKLLGRSREEALGTPIVDHLHPDDVASTTQAVRQMVQSKQLARGIVSRYVTPIGTRVTEWNGYPIFDEQGRYAGVHGTGRDVTERRQAEEALRESEERFHTLSDATFEAIAVHEKGKIVDANRTYAEMFGYEPSEIIGMHALDFAAPESRDLVWQSILSRREEPFEAIGLRKDGSTFVGEICGKAIPYQGHMVTVAAIRDVSARKRAEEALRESEEKYRRLVQDSIDGIAVVEGVQTTLANRALLEMFGYEREEEVVGHPFTDLVSPEYRELMVQRGYARQEGEDVPARYEFKGLFKDGSEFDAEISVSAITYQGRMMRQGVIKDITERKRAEEALRESEQRYRLLAENVTDVIWTMDTNLRFTYVSPSVTQLRGYTVEEAMAQTLEEFLTPASLDVARKVLAEERAVEQMQEKDLTRSRTVELEQTCKDGSTVWTEVKMTILRDGDKRSVRVVGIGRDIAERKRAEEALRESEARYRLLAENVTDIIWAMDTNLRFTYVSPSVTRLRGYTVEEVMAQTVKEMLTPASLEVVKKAIADERAIEQMEAKDLTRSLTLEVEQTCKDGSTVWTEVKLTFLRDSGGQPIGILGITRDMTERKQVEEALRESEERLRILFEFAPDAYYLHDLQGNFVDCNRVAEELSGYKKEELIGKSLLESNLFPPEQLPRAAATVAKLVQGAPAGTHEFTLIRKDGKHVAVETRGFLVKIGNQALVLGIGRDISERKRAEEALRESEERYRRLIERAPYAIAVHSEGKFVFGNAALIEVLGGSTSDEVIGKPIWDFIHPDYQEKVKARVEATWDGETKTDFVEEKVIRVGGGVIDVEMAALPIVYQGKPAREVIIKDITARKRAEDALWESEEKFRNIFQTASDCIIYLDTSGIILDINNKAVELFGGPREELLGKHFTTVGVFHPENLPMLMDNFSRMLTGEKASVEVRIRNRKDQERFLDCSGSSLKRDGRAPVLVVIARDITERKRAEEALQKVREEIESRVERRMQQVNGYGLTFRELAVLHLVVAGESDKEIATVLGISPLTAHKHLANILEKMGAASRTEAGVRALREGLLD